MRLSREFTEPQKEWGGGPGATAGMEALEASFEAALERSEKAAAGDLAFCLRGGSPRRARQVPAPNHVALDRGTKEVLVGVGVTRHVRRVLEG